MLPAFSNVVYLCDLTKNVYVPIFKHGYNQC